MNIKKLISISAAVYAFFLLFTEGCVYTAMACFLILSAIGFSPVYCIGEVEGHDFNHAWVRVDSYNIEQSKLNLHHSDNIDYDNPHLIFNTTKEFIENNLIRMAPKNRNNHPDTHQHPEVE